MHGRIEESQTPHLSYDEVSHAYGRHVSIRALSLDVRPGELICLLGPSGCGKSTALRLAAGLEMPHAGRISLQGRIVSGDGIAVPPEERRVGLVFQEFALFPHLTVLDNVCFGLNALSNEQAKARAHECLEIVGLAASAKKFPNMLSGGEQQRVALARALAPQPGIMLMDEPFSGLDKRLRDRVRGETLRILKTQGATSLIVTHDPEEALFMADRIALMRQGRLVQVGSPHELYNAPADLEVAAFFSDLNTIEGQVRGGRFSCPLGDFDAGSLGDGQAAVLAFRGHAVHFSKAGGGDSNATIVSCRFVGDKLHVSFALSGREDQIHQGEADVGQALEPGDAVRVTLDPQDSFVFAAG